MNPISIRIHRLSEFQYSAGNPNFPIVIELLSAVSMMIDPDISISRIRLVPQNEFQQEISCRILPGVKVFDETVEVGPKNEIFRFFNIASEVDFNECEAGSYTLKIGVIVFNKTAGHKILEELAAETAIQISK